MPDRAGVVDLTAASGADLTAFLAAAARLVAADPVVASVVRRPGDRAAARGGRPLLPLPDDRPYAGTCAGTGHRPVVGTAGSLVTRPARP